MLWLGQFGEMNVEPDVVISGPSFLTARLKLSLLQILMVVFRVLGRSRGRVSERG